MVALFLVAAVSVLSAGAVQSTAMRERRDQEARLMYVGQAYLKAIRTYYQNSPGYSKQYPPDLQSLLQDARSSTMSRPLRNLYADPITNSQNWGIVPSSDGGVMGVYSLSTRQPVQTAGFPLTLAGFVGAKTYQDWKFVYQPG
jgi:type II secretory pathway pseudopilin PulG